MNARGKKPGRLTEADRERWREMLTRKDSVIQQGYRAVMGERARGTGGIPRPRRFAEILARIETGSQDASREASQDDRAGLVRPGRQRGAQSHGRPGQGDGQAGRQRSAQGRGGLAPDRDGGT